MAANQLSRLARGKIVCVDHMLYLRVFTLQRLATRFFS